MKDEKMKKRSIFAVLIIFFLALALPVKADYVKWQDGGNANYTEQVNDTMLALSYPTTQYGANIALIIGSNNGGAGNNDMYRSLYDFNLSRMSSVTLSDVNFTLEAYTTAGNPTLQIFMVTSPWTENTTYNTAPTYENVSLQSVALPASYIGNITFNSDLFKDRLQSIVNGTNKNYGFMVKQDVEQVNVENETYARASEYTSTLARPALRLDYSTSTCALTSSAGWSFLFGTATTLTCICDDASNLYFNGLHNEWNNTAVTFGATSGSGIICNSTTATASNTLIVNKQFTYQLNLSINGTQSNASYPFGNVTNATSWTEFSGATTDLYRNGTSVSNPDILQLGAGYYNYTSLLTHANYTSNVSWFLTVAKIDSQLSLTSSLGWIVYAGQSTVLNCSAKYGTPSLKIQSSVVTSPYTLATQSGSYTVNCSVSNPVNYTSSEIVQELYANPLIACTNNNTFAFNKTISPVGGMLTFNFTSLVNQSLVRKNMGDVYANVTNAWINTTGGYFFIVNTSGISSFVLKFGNYYANRTYTNRATDNITAVENYNQENYYTTFNILNEMSGEYFYPPSTTLTAIITCARGENYIQVENSSSTADTKFTLATLGPLTKASVRVKYTADMYYSRQFYPSASNSLSLNFYVADAYQVALDRLDFLMQDPAYYGLKLQIYKTIQNSKIVITEGYFDASHYFSAYLLEDMDYFLQTVSSTGAVTDFGRITVVKPDTKTLGKGTIALNPSAVLISENIFMNSYMNSDRTQLTIDYEDKLNQTNYVMVVIFYQNGTIFDNTTYTASTVLVNHVIPSTESNQTYSVTFLLSHQTLGNSPIKYYMSLPFAVTWGLGISAVLLNLVSLGMILGVGGITTRESIVGGSLLTLSVFGLLIAIGWLTNMWVLFAFVLYLFMLAIINHLQKENQ